ncbi:MAG TPA: hypothetical protein VJL59_19615 [Anaerolineales bacterium]|nr:hypothetical protein [Anaerolineales bacterium]
MNKKPYRDILDSAAVDSLSQKTNLWPRIESRLDKRNSFMQTLRARPALALIIILLALSLLTGVVYAIGKSLGYIPGVGIIDQSVPLRVLAEPVTITRDGVTITVTDAVLSADKTVIFVKVEGVPSEAYPTDESIGCMGNANLRLADGTLLEGGYIGAGGWTHFENRLEYGPIPANVNEAVLTFDCIGFTRPGALPENWEIPLRFVPAPPDMTVAPVIELSTPAARNPPAADVTSTPVLSNTMTLNGITLTLEKFVEVEGGYQLYGSLDLSKLSLPAQSYFNTMGLLTLTDANGNRIPFEEARLEPEQNSVYDPNKLAWIYRTNQKAFAGPLVLSLSSVEMQITPQIPFELDLGSNPQIGQTWEINRDLTFEEHTIRLLSAQLVKSDDPQWASFLKFTYEDKEGGIFINVMDDVPQTPLIEVLGGGGGGGPLTGKKLAWMNYGEIPNGLRRFTISATVQYRISGPWQVIWNPPSTTEPIPTSAPEACLTSEKWEQAKGQHEALPAGLGGKILFTTDAMPPDINVFIVNLDGSDPRGLVSDYYPSLSPDGTKALFSTDTGLNVFDINSGQTTALEGIWGGISNIWSPDGSRILLDNPPDGLYIVNADGTGMQKIETGSPRVNPIGWLPDNQTIVFGAQVGDIYNLYEHVFKTYNLQTGETKSLFPITIKTPSGTISPNGQWIAYRERLFGAGLDGAVFISRLDGSERKLVAMLDNALAFHPVWSPDGQWLIVSVVEPYKPTNPVLVNPFTCQSMRLENVRGEVQAWRP